MAYNAEQTSAHDTITGPDDLTPEQWRSLARLADTFRVFESSLHNGAAAPGTAALDRLGEGVTKHDLPAVADELLGTLKTLRDSGLLARVRNNAMLINDTLNLLSPMTGEVVTQLNAAPIEEFKQELAELRDVAKKIRLTRTFIEENLADDLTAVIVDATRFWQDSDLTNAIKELLTTISHLHKTGFLSRLRKIAEQSVNLDEGLDLEKLTLDVTRQAKGLRLNRLMQLAEGMEYALESAQQDEKNLGGMKGMLHLIRDKEFQKGIHAISVLPVYLEKLEKTGS